MEIPTVDMVWMAVIAAGGALSVFLIVYSGWEHLRRFIARQEQRIDGVLNQQLLMDVKPRVALTALAAGMAVAGLFFGLISESVLGFVVGAVAAAVLPHLVVGHLEAKRRRRLEEQIVDGTTSLASGVRAGLNLVQAMELLVRNGSGPLRQEMQQLMREYELGIDLGAAMHNASNRIGSSYYRLLFAAIQAHRDRGGDMGQSLDRIADSIREIQRLEGRLQALTAQGRAQARFMAAMPVVIFFMLWTIDPDDTALLITDPVGRLLLLFAIVLIAVAFVWIRRIMAVDI